jgi:hypothetical protein
MEATMADQKTPEAQAPQPAQAPPQIMLERDPAFVDATLRAERDGLASALGRLQIQLNESQEMNHCLRRELESMRAQVEVLTKAGKAAGANRAERRRAQKAKAKATGAKAAKAKPAK